MIKRLISFATVMLSLSMFASLTPFALSSHEISNKTEISDTTAPRISQYAEAYLFTDVYTDIISDNNWIDAVVTVTNHSNNPGGVRVYVSNEQGDMIGRVKYIEAGESTTLKVPFDAGYYTIWGQAYDTIGDYLFYIND